eukprot:168206_1
MIHIFQSLLLLNSLLFNGGHCFSACDEIDIAFVIDTDSVIANSEGVIKLVTNVILSGSSEHSGFSVVIYGHNIPIDQKIKIVSLHDTKDATQREAAEKAVDNVLRKAFDNIKSISSPVSHSSYASARQGVSDNEDEEDNNDRKNNDQNDDNDNDDQNDDNRNDADATNEDETDENNKEPDTVEGSATQTKSIDLVPAFKIATGQSRPHHEGNRKLKLGYDPSDTSVIGDHDNQQVYIIFDHNNKLLRSDNDVDICALFHHLDTNQIRNDDEAVYFMMGQSYTQDDIEAIFCNKVMPSYIKKDTFYRFTPKFAYNPSAMERIYCLTCPAEIKSHEYKGKINVGNHVQYIDLKTVIECELFYYDDDDDSSTTPTLDETKSYVKVKDFVNDDNTFKVDDKLLVTQSIRKELKELNCNAPVYKTVKIVKDEDSEVYNTGDDDESNDYQILKLYVKLPSTPMEYMQNANVHGTVKKHYVRDEAEKEKKEYNEYDDYSQAKYQETNLFEEDEEEEEQRKLREEDVEWFDEVRILKGEMDHLLEDDSLLAATAHNILRERAKKMKRRFHKLVKLRKIRRKLMKTFPLHKRYYGSTQFAAKLMADENRLMAMADGPFGFSLTDLLLGRIKAHGELTLLKIGKKQEWKMTKVDEDVEVEGKLPEKWELSAFGDGQLMVRFGYTWGFSVGIKFKFFWQIWTPIVDITFLTFIEWDVGAFFYVQSLGLASMQADNLFYYEKEITFSIGPVPVQLTPYVEIYIVLESAQQEFYHGGIQCRYNERLYMGFRYCNTFPWCKPGPIKKKITKHKGCEPKLGIYRHLRERDYGHEMQCPRQDEDLGFNIKVNVKIGVILYSIVNLFLRMEFVIPFRTHYPVMNPRDCYLPKHLDMCRVTKKTLYLKANFYFSMHLNIYLGVTCDMMGILLMIMGIFGVPLPPAAAPEFEFKILGPIPIIPKISLGCSDLKGPILELDTSLRHACCSRTHYLPIEPKHPYYDQMYMDYYGTNYADGSQNPYYDDPHYTDVGFPKFDDKKHFNIHDPYHGNDEHDYSAQYYSPAYHFPKSMRPIMKQWKKQHYKETHEPKPHKALNVITNKHTHNKEKQEDVDD